MLYEISQTVSIEQLDKDGHKTIATSSSCSTFQGTLQELKARLATTNYRVRDTIDDELDKLIEANDSEKKELVEPPPTDDDIPL